MVHIYRSSTMSSFVAPKNVLGFVLFRELQELEKFFFMVKEDNPICYAFHLEFDSQDAKQQLPHKLQLCLKILMKRHPLLRACVRQQPQSQPPRFFFCELQPTADCDVTPELTTDMSSDWQQEMTSLVAQTFKHDEERPLWSVVYMPNVTSPSRKNQHTLTVDGALIVRMCHAIADAQSTRYTHV